MGKGNRNSQQRLEKQLANEEKLLAEQKAQQSKKRIDRVVSVTCIVFAVLIAAVLVLNVLSETGVFIRSLFPKNHIFRLDVDNSSKLLHYLENGLGYSFLPYKLAKDKIDSGDLEEVALKDFTAPNVTTYLIYRQNYDAKRFLENKFD